MVNRKLTNSTITLLDKGCEFSGKLSFEGVVRIDGVFQGEIYSQDHLIIGEGAVVEANIQVGKLEVGGTFKGKIIANETLVIHGTGKITGEIQTKELEVHRGGVMDAQVDMTTIRESVTETRETIIHFKDAKESASLN